MYVHHSDASASSPLNGLFGDNHPKTTNPGLHKLADTIKSLVGKLGVFVDQLNNLQGSIKSLICVRSSMISSPDDFFSNNTQPLIEEVYEAAKAKRQKADFLAEMREMFVFEKDNRQYLKKKNESDQTSHTNAFTTKTISDAQEFISKWELDSNAPRKLKDRFNKLVEQSTTLQEPKIIDIPKKTSPIQTSPKAPHVVQNEAIRERIRTLLKAEQNQAIVEEKMQELDLVNESSSLNLNEPQNPARLLLYIQQFKDTSVSTSTEYKSIEKELRTILGPTADQQVIQAEILTMTFQLEAPGSTSLPSMLAYDIKDSASLNEFFTQCQPKNTASDKVKARFEELKAQAKTLK